MGAMTKKHRPRQKPRVFLFFSGKFGIKPTTMRFRSIFTLTGLLLVPSAFLVGVPGCGGGGGSSNSGGPVPTATATVSAPKPTSTSTPVPTNRPSPTATSRPTATSLLLRVAAIGDSITQGVGVSDAGVNAYPALLSRRLGAKYQVRNFGVSGATLLNRSDAAYRRQTAFRSALEFQPDFVVIALGTNDAGSALTPALRNSFQTQYQVLINAFRSANPRARLFLCLPAPIFPANSDRSVTLQFQILPLIREIAAANRIEIVDLNSPLLGRSDWFSDRIHPNNAGANVIAEQVYRALIANS